MIPASFSYVRPNTLDEAMELLGRHGGKAAVIAGGQSLLTELKQRSRRLNLVIDLETAGSKSIQQETEYLTIGALGRQSDVADAAAQTPWHLLSKVAELAADPMLRNRGTFVGALCALEQGGDWAPAALVLDAELNILESDRRQSLAYKDYVARHEHFAINPHIVIDAKLPRPPEGSFCGYDKLKHVSIGWSIASVAYVFSPGATRIAISGCVAQPCRLDSLERFVAGCDATNIDLTALQKAIDENLEPLVFTSDSYASAQYRRVRLRLMLIDAIKSYSSNIRYHQSKE